MIVPRTQCSNRRALLKIEDARSVASAAEMFARDKGTRCARPVWFPAVRPGQIGRVTVVLIAPARTSDQLIASGFGG
jgi:hypothetical protein